MWGDQYPKFRFYSWNHDWLRKRPLHKFNLCLKQGFLTWSRTSFKRSFFYIVRIWCCRLVCVLWTAQWAIHFARVCILINTKKKLLNNVKGLIFKPAYLQDLKAAILSLASSIVFRHCLTPSCALSCILKGLNA